MATQIHRAGDAAPRRLERSRLILRFAEGFLFLTMFGTLALPAWPQQRYPDLTDQPLEDLMNIQVTSVSKIEQKLSQAASAVFVITQDDIEHSNATNIPDLLRMVPGIDVAQIEDNIWAISARGFNAKFANNLLVLIDGRTVYSPLFSGVYWDVQNVPLEDIDRIEVIRGPGATVWGANAVNGVINIITKSAKQTQGGLVTTGGGTHEPGFGVAQYGGKFGQATSYRFFMQGFDYNSFPPLVGQERLDGSHVLQGGFRVDSTLSRQDSLTVQGDIYTGSETDRINTVALTPPFGQALAAQISVSGGDVLGRWNHTFSPTSDTSLQIYFDSANRNRVIEKEGVDTFDLDFQHHLGLGSRQDVVWGFGYRYISYATAGSLTASFNPASQGLQLFTSFVQDEITLKPDRLYLTLGAKLEHNDFSGFEFEPSARIAWSVSRNDTLWAAFSRARGTPSPADRGIDYSLAAFPGPGGVPVLETVQGNPNTLSENLNALEAGYRAQLRGNISLDLSTYYNWYGNLTTYEPGIPFLDLNPLPPHLNVPIAFANQMHGQTLGLEMAVNWKITNRWTLSPGYAFEKLHMHLAPTSQDTTSVSAVEGSSPDHSVQLRSHLVLWHGLGWDTSAYFVGRLTDPSEASYTRLDTGLSWHFSEGASLSFVGQNLLRDRHEEFVDSPPSANTTTLVKRSAYVRLRWQF